MWYWRSISCFRLLASLPYMSIDRAAGDMELAGDEYIEPADGLIHCKKCRGSRQTVVLRFGGSDYFIPRCLCPCQQKAQEERKAMEKAHAYVEHWKEAYRDNTGLLLFGDVGTGKSFFAGCIANALLDRDVPVLMTNFPSILNRLTGVFAEDRAAFITSLDDYSLLIIDDLGVERNTEYAMEQMFTVIDSRYRSKKPLIVTTNLKLEEIKNPPDLAHARIYDRILERCAPVLFSGKNLREEGARATKAAAKEIVSKG